MVVDDRDPVDQLSVSWSTSTRWPTATVGAIESLGIRYECTNHAWTAKASQSQMTTVTLGGRLPARTGADRQRVPMRSGGQ